MNTPKALEVLKTQIEIVEGILAEMRAEFDGTTHPYATARLAQDIAIAAAKLDALEHLRKILGGTK